MPPSSKRRVLGRDAELARFARWTRDLISGHSTAVLVEGEPGTGKSALVAHACDRTEDLGAHVFWGAGDELATPLLLSPLLEAFGIGPGTDDPRRRSIIEMLSGASAAKSSDELVTAV